MIEKIKSMIREPGIGGKMLSVLRKGSVFVVVMYRKRVCGYTIVKSYDTLEDAVEYIQSALETNEMLGMVFNEKWIEPKQVA